MREGDVVVVVALDRLGRSLPGIIRTVQTVFGRCADPKIIGEWAGFGTRWSRVGFRCWAG
ncbi:MAG: hypothetical protein M3Y48_10265 [Actinomycetota bacterium]|nr:hypothetical protein [Actinomycetota bacterium]